MTNSKLMRKRMFVLALCMIGVMSVKAQLQMGVTAGSSVNTLSTHTHYAYDLNYKKSWGWTFGIPVTYSFNEWFALRADAILVQKNYGMDRGGFFRGRGIGYDVRSEYFSLPVVTQFSFGDKRLRGFINGGGYVGYWLSYHRTEGVLTFMDLLRNAHRKVYSDKNDFDSRRDNRFDAGVTAGVGMEFIPTPRIGITIEARQYYGLSNLYKNKIVGEPRYNTTWTFQVGCKYYFKENNNIKK